MEPALKLPVIVRSRSKQCHYGPGHCLVGYYADTCTRCRNDDEMYVDDNLTARDASTHGPARPSVCRGDIGYLSANPPALMCRGIFTDDDDTEIEFKATPQGNGVNKGSITLTTAEANGHHQESPRTYLTSSAQTRGASVGLDSVTVNQQSGDSYEEPRSSRNFLTLPTSP